MNQLSGSPCSQAHLGKECTNRANNVLAPNSHSSWTIGRRVTDLLDPDKFTGADLDSMTNRGQYDELSDLQEIALPLAIIYIYCAPCACLIATAFKICRTAGKRASTLFSLLVRPDDSLSSSCCSNTDRSIGLASLVEAIKNYEISGDNSLSYLELVDKSWIERRLFEIDEVGQLQPSTNILGMAQGIFKSHESPRECAGIIILGELDFCLPIMHCPPFPRKSRIPRETEVFRMSKGLGSSWTRKYLGTYTPKPLPHNTSSSRGSVAGVRPRDLSTQASIPLPSMPLSSVNLPTRQVSPPPSPASKRQKTSASLSVSAHAVDEPANKTRLENLLTVDKVKINS
jgi:hypothetical protein